MTKKEKFFLESAAIDYVSLSEIVRLTLNYKKIEPTEKEYLQALDFLSYLIQKYNLKYSMGPGVEIINKTPEELLNWLQEMWYAGKYDEISYGIWFELE